MEVKLPGVIAIIMLIIGAIVGSIYLFGYCHDERNCSFITIDKWKFEVDYEYRRPPENKFAWLDEGSILRTDDFYRLKFRTSPQKGIMSYFLPIAENKFVYIFQIDNDNKIILLPIQADSTKLTPQGEAVRQLDNNLGQKEIYFLTFREPNQALEKLYAGILDARKQPMTRKLDELQRDLIKQVKEIQQEKQNNSLLFYQPVIVFQQQEKLLDVKVKHSFRSQGESEFQALINDSILYSGDQYRIQFTPSEDSYVYIFQVTTTEQTQEVNRLFPCFNADLKDQTNPVGAHEYHLPAENGYWTLDDQQGTEKIYLLALKANKALASKYQEIDQACEQLPVLNTDNLPFAWEELSDNIFRHLLVFKHQN